MALPQEIKQSEISALLGLATAQETLALDFRRRLEVGARVQRGRYRLVPSAETVDEMAASLDSTNAESLTMSGFDLVGRRTCA